MANQQPANSAQMAPKLRILCLHGYRQTAESFRAKSGALRKRLKAVAEFDYVDGAVEVPSGEDSGIPEEEGRAGGRGWWSGREDGFFRATHESDFLSGFEESVAALEAHVASRPRYDGVLGFSQGAAMALLWCLRRQQRHGSPGFRFAILVSAFKSRQSPHAPLYASALDIPTLHVMGETDQVISVAMSSALLPLCPDSTLSRHGGGHYLPGSADTARDVKAFLSRFTNDGTIKDVAPIKLESNGTSDAKGNTSDGNSDNVEEEQWNF